MKAPIQGICIIGNDTEVGKTTVACDRVRTAIAAGRSVGVFKPAASGCTGPDTDDVARLAQATGRSIPADRVCPYRFREPLAPLLAARREGRTIAEDVIQERLAWWYHECDYLIVETAGGALSPLTERWSNLDFAAAISLPIIVVVANVLGGINQAMLVCEAVRSRQLPIAEVVFNDCDPGCSELVSETNVELFRQLSPGYLGGSILEVSRLLHRPVSGSA